MRVDDRSGHEKTCLDVLVPRMFLAKAILGGHKLAKSRPRRRRSFGRIEQLPSGRWRAAYKGPDEQLYRGPMTFKSEDDAIAWVSARRAEIEMEVWAPDAAARGAMQRSAPTFGAYAAVWLEGRKTKGRQLR